jgi:hypothetical protein
VRTSRSSSACSAVIQGIVTISVIVRRTLTAALAAAKNEMRGILDESAHAVAQAVTIEIDAALARVHLHAREANRIAVCNVFAAFATFAAAAIWIFLR